MSLGREEEGLVKGNWHILTWKNDGSVGRNKGAGKGGILFRVRLVFLVSVFDLMVMRDE